MESRYIHGTAPAEQARLSLLNELLNPSSLAALALAGRERVLDVGCGLGQLTAEIAAAVGEEGAVLAIERDPEQRRVAGETLVERGVAAWTELRAGSAPGLPLAEDEWGTFDIAHCRFLLEHVPDPQAVVGAMVRAVRPGGRVVLEDDDHELLRLWPPAPAVDRLWRAYYSTYEALGNDPLVGRRLVELLVGAGARPRRTSVLPFGTCAGDPLFYAYVENFAGVLEGARERIVECGALEDEDVDRGLVQLERWAERPDAALWYSTAWAEGTRP